MQRAIRHYIQERSDYLKDVSGSYINQTFLNIEREIIQIIKMEIKKAREKKLMEWRRKEKLNCRHNDKKLGGLRR